MPRFVAMILVEVDASDRGMVESVGASVVDQFRGIAHEPGVLVGGAQVGVIGDLSIAETLAGLDAALQLATVKRSGDADV